MVRVVGKKNILAMMLAVIFIFLTFAPDADAHRLP